MAKASERAPVLGPAFIRLLARFNDEGASPAAPAVPERLAQWFDWNRAITLSKALDNPPPEPEPGADYAPAQDAEYANVRAKLVETIQAEIGPVSIKIVTMPDGTERAYPEYDSVAALAKAQGLPFQMAWRLVLKSLDA